MKGIIYIATNLFNGRSYVGQTRRTLEERMNRHYQDAKKQDSTNEFHLALTQYGKDAFEWKVLDEFFGTKEEVIHALNVAEEYHILKHRTFLDEGGYNSTRGGYSSDKFASAIKRRAKTDGRYKGVLQYDLDGAFIKEWESISDVCRHFGCSSLHSNIILMRPWKGYQWRKKESMYFPRKIDAYKKARRESPVVAYTSDGNFFKEYKSLNQCRIDLDKQYNAREEICDVTIPSHLKDNLIVFKKKSGNYPSKINVTIVKSKREKETLSILTNIPVLQYSREGEFLREFPSIIDAHRATGIAEGSIRTWCKKPMPIVVRNSNVSYVWRYKDNEIAERIEVVGMEHKQYAPKMEHRVVQCDLSGNPIKVWETTLAASRETGESVYVIRKIIGGSMPKRQSKYIWKKYQGENIAV